MIEINEKEFKQCEPFNDREFPQGMKHLLESPLLPALAQSYFPSQSYEQFVTFLRTLEKITDFQAKVISPLVKEVLLQSSQGLSLSGIENLCPEKKYLFISNHRDIICDPALFTNSLFLRNYGTPKICLGDNLLTHPLVNDLVKMNKGITVKRNLPPRELLKWSKALSNYICRQITNGIDSVWIAQREGRAKDGRDQTQAGILKMLTLSSQEPFLHQLKNLHIVPVAISYEYDPCDVFKARELYLTELHGCYEKAPTEDVMSMITGIRGNKGKIHIGVGPDLSPLLEKGSLLSSKRDQVEFAVKLLDQEIHLQYKNHPSHYIAYDLLHNTNAMKGRYTQEKKIEFESRMRERLNGSEFEQKEKEGITRYLLTSYANSIQNLTPATTPISKP